jgi:hypothetical protein
MDTRGADLAVRFAQVSDAVIAAVEGLSESDLARECAAERCTVGALAGHVAMVFEVQVDWVQAILAGRPLPEVTMADIDRNNAEQAARNAQIGKDEVLTRLRTNRERMLAVLRSLHDGDSDRVAAFSLFNGADVSIQTLVEHGLIAHAEEHLASLRATVEPPVSAPAHDRS